MYTYTIYMHMYGYFALCYIIMKHFWLKQCLHHTRSHIKHPRLVITWLQYIGWVETTRVYNHNYYAWGILFSNEVVDTWRPLLKRWKLSICHEDIMWMAVSCPALLMHLPQRKESLRIAIDSAQVAAINNNDDPKWAGEISTSIQL